MLLVHRCALTHWDTAHCPGAEELGRELRQRKVLPTLLEDHTFLIMVVIITIICMQF